MSKTKKAPVGDKKVRDYLAFLADPEIAVNQALVAKAQTALDNCKDAVDSVLLYQKLQDAKRPDGSKLEAGFIQVGKRWADSLGIDAIAFVKVHEVPRSVLREAGFSIRTGEYKPRVTSGEVQKWVLDTSDPFQVSDVVEATAASVAGARNVLKSMVEAKQVKVLPKDPKAVFPGRPPVRYQKVA